jgi:hypothetical protein
MPAARHASGTPCQRHAMPAARHAGVSLRSIWLPSHSTPTEIMIRSRPAQRVNEAASEARRDHPGAFTADRKPVVSNRRATDLVA